MSHHGIHTLEHNYSLTDHRAHVQMAAGYVGGGGCLVVIFYIQQRPYKNNLHEKCEHCGSWHMVKQPEPCRYFTAQDVACARGHLDIVMEELSRELKLPFQVTCAWCGEGCEYASFGTNIAASPEIFEAVGRMRAIPMSDKRRTITIKAPKGWR